LDRSTWTAPLTQNDGCYSSLGAGTYIGLTTCQSQAPFIVILCSYTVNKHCVSTKTPMPGGPTVLPICHKGCDQDEYHEGSQ
jgi:hypothetical protein